MKRALRAAIPLAALAIAAAGVIFWYASSGRLSERARARIVGEVERATGGRAAIGHFAFDWRTMTAEIDGAVLHGTEQPGSPPLFSADRIVVQFRIRSFLERKIDLLRVMVERPQIHLIVAADGTTNVPRPEIGAPSGIQQILDLAIGNFDARNGVFLAEAGGHSRFQPWSAAGRNLRAQLNYDAAGPRYAGSIAVAPMRIVAADFGSFDLNARAQVEIGRDRLRISSATLQSKQSELLLSNLTVQDFRKPVVISHYEAHVSLADFVAQAGKIDSAGDLHFVSLDQFTITGRAQGEGMNFGQFHGARGSAAIEVQPGRIELNGIRAHVAEGEIFGSAVVRDLRDFKIDGRLERFAARPLISQTTLAAAMRQAIPYNARLSGAFEASGALSGLARGHFVASAHLIATPDACAGCIPVNGDIQAKYDGNTRTLELGPSSVTLPATRIDVSGVPGRQLSVKLETRNLEDLRPVFGHSPFVTLDGGNIAFTGTVTGPLTDPAIAGRMTARRAKVNGQPIDAFSGDIAVGKDRLSVKSGLVTEGSLKARISGSLALVDWQPSEKSALDATAQVSGADVKKLLAMAGEKNVDFSGSGTADAHVTGTLAEPRVNASMSLAGGLLYGQPYDTLTARAENAPQGSQLFELTFISGPKRVNANGHFDHPPGAPPFTGTITFHAQSNTMALNQIAMVRARQPDLHGTAQFRGDGSARIGRDAKGDLTFDLLGVNGDASASKIELEGRDLGDARLTASTSQDTMTVRFDSNAAGASIHGSATVQLERDYPLSAAVTFSRARLNALAMLIAKPEQTEHLNFDGTAAGELTLRGPARDWGKLSGTLSIPEIEIYPVAEGNCGTEGTCAGIRNYRLQNSGPVQLSLANGIVDVGSARFTGPQTDISVRGTFGFTERTGYNLRAAGDLNLALASTFSTDFATSGSLHVDAALRGVLNAPDLSGRMEIRNGAARYTGFANGLSNVNAALIFNGDRATIQNFSGESGGGQVNMSGFVALTGGTVAFRLQARTAGMRLRFAEGASVVSDSTITFAGTSQRSEASGTITVHRVTINPRADLSNIFARGAEPVKTATVQAGLLSKLNLDVQIETAPDVALETSMAQRIQADANLRLRGTATNPALLGRINITSGELMFFGNKYTITQGEVSFLNPSRIDPILNVDLETRARGVDVILTIAGPLTKPGVSYRSDPPLQFSDIVALLATGRSPYDPGLPTGAAGQQQAFAQVGASQLIGEAIANPASGRLQRFFGVTKAKIDPQLTYVTGSPESRLTIEQQVSPDILFTYITDVSNTSTQLIRVEWSFNRNWSAIVTREENGYVGLDFSYRKRFK